MADRAPAPDTPELRERWGGFAWSDENAKKAPEIVACEAITMPSPFQDFDDLWQPFTLGAGPAPGYCTSLPPAARERLHDKLRDSLPIAADGSIPLELRAWAVRGVSP